MQSGKIGKRIARDRRHRARAVEHDALEIAFRKRVLSHNGHGFDRKIFDRRFAENQRSDRIRRRRKRAALAEITVVNHFREFRAVIECADTDRFQPCGKNDGFEICAIHKLTCRLASRHARVFKEVTRSGLDRVSIVIRPRKVNDTGRQRNGGKPRTAESIRSDIGKRVGKIDRSKRNALIEYTTRPCRICGGRGSSERFQRAREFYGRQFGATLEGALLDLRNSLRNFDRSERRTVFKRIFDQFTGKIRRDFIAERHFRKRSHSHESLRFQFLYSVRDRKLGNRRSVEHVRVDGKGLVCPFLKRNGSQTDAIGKRSSVQRGDACGNGNGSKSAALERTGIDFRESGGKLDIP